MNMRKISSFLILFFCCCAVVVVRAQQLPDPHFEDWSSSFDGNAQPANWHGSNVSQAGFDFTFLYKQTGRSGSCAYVSNKKVGAFGITELSPGYFGLGKPWTYIKGIDTGTGSGGIDGGISFKFRPDTLSVWIKATGSNRTKEDFNILFYAWKGQSRSDKYMGKGGSCSSTTHYDEESDIRVALNHNTCGTTTYATQIAEGWLRERKEYNDWVNVRVPIYYFNDDVPEKVNVIFAAGNYPNYRRQSGMYSGNGLYVDDVELIYSSKIQKLYIDGVVWNGFNPNTEEEQIYSLGENATRIPDIYAMRGAGTLTNPSGESATMVGRRLSSSEMTITKGAVGDVTTIRVKAEDGTSETTYRIRFVKTASTNTYLANITVNGVEQTGFNTYAAETEVSLPYGTTAAPVIGAVGQEAEQTFVVTQAASLNDKATIVVTAADGKSTRTYTIRFKVAQLSDNTLKDILVNGTSVPGFQPGQTTYRVSLPLGTTKMPDVKAVSAYPEGAQTITYQAPSQIEGGTYQILVTTPGNTSPKIYKLNFRLEASTYSLLKGLTLDGVSVPDFSAEQLTYYVTLPMGTTAIPTVGYEQGDPYQTVTVTPSDVNGTTLVTVKAASGAISVYKIIFTTPLSENSLLDAIYLNGKLIGGFNPNIRTYQINLPIGTTEEGFPTITWKTMDEYQKVEMVTGGVNGTTRITVTAGNGTTTQYQLQFKVMQDVIDYLLMIYIDGEPLPDFDSDRLTYTHQLPADATVLPVVTYDKGSRYQTVTERAPSGLSGDYTLTVRPQSGATRKYTIRFTQQQSGNALLGMIRLDGVDMESFDANTFAYFDTLPAGVSTLPVVTAVAAEPTQKVVSVREGNQQTITVTAQDGTVRVYTITFVIQKSESAFLSMIYLDGDSLQGFDPNTLSYTETLLTATCPAISVKRADSAQHVTITTPYGAGQAKIFVQPEAGSPNTYTIDFVAAVPTTLQLAGVEIDGVAMTDFDPATLTYTLPMGTTLPVVTPLTQAGQTATVMSKNNVVNVYVQSGNDKGQYVFTFVHTPSTDAHLAGFSLDGVPYTDFDADNFAYTIPLAAGSAIPSVDYQPASSLQTVYAGMTDATTYQVKVVAEDGTSTNIYTIQFAIAPYNDARLENLVLEGETLGFDPDTYDYYIAYEAGKALPELTAATRDGQFALVNTINDSVQEVLVMSQSGARTRYVVHYQRIYSDNVQLKTILIGGDTLEGFAPEVTAYVDSLPWRTRVVPSIMPVGALSTQTITTYRSGVNGTTRIHVVAPNGVATRDYTIAFPLPKSDNTALSDLFIISDDVELPAFSADQTDYEVLLPYGTMEAPAIRFEKAEPEQTVRQMVRPVGQTSEIIVTAENGDKRTYRITFKVDTPHQPNLLTAIGIQETGETLDLSTDSDRRDFTVNLPYGTRSMTVTYSKQYADQTVIVEAGGVNAPTRLVVKANVDTVADEIYTLTPVIPTADPAVLTDIQVNGVTINGFDSERFSYIVPITDAPIVRIAAAEGVSTNTLVQTNKHYQVEVTYKGRVNTYDLWYYYEEDVIPNGEFSNWTTARYNSGAKPVGWSVIADAAERYLTYRSGPECTQSSTGVVKLLTEYRGICARSVPGFITLGSITGSLGTTNVFNFSGSITFRNTPDELSINYKAPNIQRHNRIVYELWGSTGYDKVEHNDETEFNDFRTLTLDLTTANHNVGEPNAMNIFLNSNYQETGNLGTDGGFGTHGEMHIDWIRLGYNPRLTAITANGIVASRSGNNFTVRLTDPEGIELPQLVFAGEVSDQARLVTWSDETAEDDYGIRTATIRNYAENGTDYEDYTLRVERPLCTVNTLSALHLGGMAITGFTPAKTAYTCHLKAGQTLPDLQAFPASSRQQLNTVITDDSVTVTVTPEYGEALTYVVYVVRDKSSDTSLDYLTEVNAFDPAQDTYTFVGDSMPDFYFTRAHALQTVEVNNGIITVMAEDSTTGKYTVTLLPREYISTAQLSEMELDGTPWQSFNPDTYVYTAEQPQTVLYKQAFDRDSLIFTQTPAGMSWQLFGSPDGTTQTYRINYPTAYSTETRLSGIYVDGNLLDGFDADVTDYTLSTDTTVTFRVVKTEDGQQVVITEADSVYTIRVIAEDKTNTATYTLTIDADLSDNADLLGIRLDGIPVEGFRADSFTYVVTLPAPSVKTAEPQMPALTYTRAQHQQQVDVQTGLVGESSYLTVTAETGKVQTYEVLVLAEPSHNADLTGIVVNDMPMERFEVGRHYYSTWAPADHIDIDWTSDDNFQTVTLNNDGYTYTIHVVAQDGVTTQDYQVEIFVESVPNDARLKDILLDGIVLSDFEAELNPKLQFDPDNNTYIVNLPAQTAALPQVYAMLKMDGQSVDIQQSGNRSIITVTAKDGVTKIVYTVDFVVQPSSVATLDNIYLDGKLLTGFVPTGYYYYEELPVGVNTLPEVVYEKHEAAQTVQMTDATASTMRTTIQVTAEDGISKATYTIVYAFRVSDNCQLNMLYLDGDTLTYTAGNDTLPFAPTEQNYTISLPVGTTIYPDITWDAADPWQRVGMQTISESQYRKMVQVYDTAASGKIAVYTLTFEIQQSANTALTMLQVDNYPIAGFTPDQTDYFYTVPAGTTVLPKVEYETGDTLQTAVMDTLVDNLIGQKSLEKKVQITVTAQNHASRIYTVHFPMELSQDTLLAMIWHNGQPLSVFNKEVLHYQINVPYNEDGLRIMPAITVSKSLPEQKADIVAQGDSVLVITVLAEDGLHQATYRIDFAYGRSPITTLADILVEGESLAEFDAAVNEYTLYRFAEDTIPAISWIKSDPMQHIDIDLLDLTDAEGFRTVTLNCAVTAPDQEHYADYTVYVRFSLTELDTITFSARLDSLFVKGMPVTLDNGFDQDFHADSLHYAYRAYPIGSTQEAFFTAEDITYRTHTVDTLTHVSTETNSRLTEDGREIERTIVVQVSDYHYETTLRYEIVQRIELSHDSTIAAIFLDGEPMLDFDPDVHAYQVHVKGKVPGVTFLTRDSLAYAPEVTPGVLTTDTTTQPVPFVVMCMSEYAYNYDKTNEQVRNVYTIEFILSDVDETQRPEANDVLVKIIPNSTQIAFASLRSNVQIGIYDASGHMLFYRILSAVDPRYAVVTKDTNGADYFNDVTDLSKCTVVTLDSRNLYFYTIFENGKRVIKSGKLIFAQ